MAGRDRISRNEIRKDVAQEAAESVVTTTGVVAGIVVGAVRDVTRAVGSLATDLFELREAAGRAQHDTADPSANPERDRAEDDSPGTSAPPAG